MRLGGLSVGVSARKSGGNHCKYIQVESPRANRATVPRPSQILCAKPMTTLGDKLCDALGFLRLDVGEEQTRLDDAHNNDNIPS